MKIIVVDASVVAAYLLDHDADIEQKVRTLFHEERKHKIHLLSTGLLSLEVANALRFRLRDQALANETFEKFQQLPIDIVPLTAVQISKSLRVAYECGTTVYDASYHVLALVRNGEYLTADGEYYRKAKHLGKIVYVG